MSRQQMITAQKILKARGWEHIASIMVDDPSDGRFGLLYVKGIREDRREFFLNLKTINSLPSE